MTEPLSDARLEEIRGNVTGICSCCGYDVHEFEVIDVQDLLDEVDRLRAKPLLLVEVKAPLGEEDAARIRAQLESAMAAIRDGRR